MRISALACSIFLMFNLSTSVQADEFESTTLFQKGSWNVELTFDTKDGDLWCSAETQNASGQSLAITGYDSGSIALFVFDQSWNISDRPIRFLIDIDYSRWTMNGHGRGISISLVLNDADSAILFLRELMEGNAVALMNADERRLATFSLSGSSAAIRNFFACWDKITVSDPFTNETDPFIGVADPF